MTTAYSESSNRAESYSEVFDNRSSKTILITLKIRVLRRNLRFQLSGNRF